MTILFISDLHLSENHPVLLERFKELMSVAKGNIDGLYILGDFFESWIGDDLITPFHDEVALLLTQCSAFFPIYLMPGNRDFLLGPDFYARSHARLLNDPSWLYYRGVEMLLLHGDSLACDANIYGLYRKCARSSRTKRWFLKRSSRFRKGVARLLMRNHSDDLRYAADVKPKILERFIEDHHPKILIHGHTHFPLVNPANETRSYSRYVLGAWSSTGNALILQDSGEFKWIQFQTIADLQLT